MTGGALVRPTVAVLGGSVAGLAAAEAFASFADVSLYERQFYDQKRVNCGEAINEATLVPLAKTPENGFLNRVDGFDISIYPATNRDLSVPPLATPTIRVDDGYITDRNEVEKQWAARLSDRGVDIHEGANVSPSRYRELVETFDYVVDATGQPALSLKGAGRTNEYSGDIVALNADVEDVFRKPSRPDIVFEGYVGYFWVFPKSETRANVGIGWAGEERPDSYLAELRAACDRFGVARPQREDVSIYTIPRGPSLDPARCRNGNVFLVGDAAGIANRYQGEGIVQAIRSSYLLAALVREGREEAYPEALYRSMRSEYRLAALMRAVWEATEDPQLLARLADAIDGLSVGDVTRRPSVVMARLLRRPHLLAKLVSVPGIRSQAVAAYTDTWEYDANADATHTVSRVEPIAR